MKKMALTTLLGLILLAGSLGLFPGNSNEAKPGSSLPLIQNSKTLDFKTGMVAPDKTGVPDKEAIIAKAASLAVPFVKNVGQFNAEVRYSADLFSGRFFLTDKELVYSLFKSADKKGARPDKFRRTEEPQENMPGKSLVCKEFFVDKKGNKIKLESNGEQQTATVVSYFKGKDPSKWHSSVASYKSVSLGQVYPGIEVKLKARGKNVEKIFYVSPQSNVADIKIGVAGIADLKIAKDGRLLFKNALGELAMRAPIAWQEITGKRCAIKVAYRLLGDRLYGFAVSGDYDENYTLVIDPDLDNLMASTFLGGGNYYSSCSLTLDNSGNIYLTGITSSADFPTTPGAYDRTYNDGSIKYPSDIFVSKLNSNLTELLASTYLGGREIDISKSLVLDSAGNVYLTGGTFSADFPTTPGGYDRTYNGGSLPGNEYFHNYYGDAFVAKLDGNLTTLLASIYLGGNNYDLSNSLALDSMNNVYLTGNTASTDFPTTPGAYDRSFNCLKSYYPCDIFVSKLNSNLTILLASTYLGGSDYNRGISLVLDSKDNVYLIGDTSSINFPTTPEAYDRTYNGVDWKGGGDVFISKLDSTLTTLLASTFLGGRSYDKGNSVVLGRSGDVFLTGETDSADFPTTPGAYNRIFSGPLSDYHGDVFISKLGGDLSNLVASTFLTKCDCMSGYSYYIHKCGKALALDSTDNVYVTGDHAGECFYEQLYYVAFVSKVDKDLTTLLGQKCIGEPCSYYASGHSLALDRVGNIYFAGYTESAFPTTPGAYNRTDKGVFIAKLNGNAIIITATSPNGGEKWSEGSSHDITWVSSTSITSVNIDYSIDSGLNWTQVATNIAGNDTYPLTSTISGAKINSTNAQESSGHLLPETAGTANTHSFAWTIPPTPSTTCLIRISDAADASINDTSDAVFSILMDLDLQVERREVKSFSISKQYGQIQFMMTHPEVPVAEYRVLRRKGTADFVLLKTITPAELQNNQFQMQDKYLKKDTAYTYRIEVYYESGSLAGISDKKTI